MILNGIAYWAKIIGKPAKAYNEGEFEWSIDVKINDETIAMLEAQGLGDKVKNKGDERGNFIQFKRKSVKSDGTPAKPIEVVDDQGEPWNGQLIGNGSTVNVVYLPNEWTMGKKTGVKANVLKVQVWDLVPYEGKEDLPVRAKPKKPVENWEEEAA